jgi:Trk K+ transport system NAD-binding subunit
MKSILIIGCGWFGKITAKLLNHSGYSVIGVELG